MVTPIPIMCFNILTKEQTLFSSITDASRILGIPLETINGGLWQGKKTGRRVVHKKYKFKAI